MWIACLSVPLFPLAARLRAEPELAAEAVVVCEGNGDRARVVAASRAARRHGVEVGQTLPQARALCPRLTARARDPECERAAHEALLEVAETVSPKVEDAEPGLAFADLHGLARRFGREGWSEAAGRALAAAAERAGLPARVGVAPGKLAAQVAAARGGEPTVVPAGGEAAFLAPLPISRLAALAPEGAEVAVTLARWGLATVGDFARLPEDEVASRLGAAGSALHAVARGRDPRPLVPRASAPALTEGMTLEWPLVALEPFLFVARAALERLVDRLETRGLACARLELALTLEPEGHDERAFALPAPSRDVKTLLTLVRLDLEARAPGAAVAGFTFAAHPDRPRAAQLSLFGPPALAPDRLAGTLARLFALLGPGRAGSPRTVGGHRPERFALVAYDPPPPPSVRPATPTGRGLMAVRALRPALPLEVLVAATEQPASLRTPVADETVRRLRLDGEVRVAAGPWALEEGWWTEEPVERDYWDVELAGGGLFRIYRDRASGDWYADGVYD